MGYKVRPWCDEDAEAVAALGRAAIAIIGPHAYSPEQASAWEARFPGPAYFRRRASEGAAILVACDEGDTPVAYVLLEADGHLDHLYSHPDHTRRGLADLLLERAEHLARSRDVVRLFTEASDLARPSFERAGYVVTHKREFEIAHGDLKVPIHNWAMEKLLA